ncbi:MAG: hypothetical protein DHS20C16_14990 [Phycisphaerae bacterium]|nr:MAG: hypothetical protein DHS20C16_14990 [Phycisphaerae bacterium]
MATVHGNGRFELPYVCQCAGWCTEVHVKEVLATFAATYGTQDQAEVDRSAERLVRLARVSGRRPWRIRPGGISVEAEVPAEGA